MAAKENLKQARKIEELEALVQIMEECPFPILRLDANGEPMFTNLAALQQDGLIDEQTGLLSASIVDTAMESFVENASRRMDVKAGAFIYDVYFNPVIKNGYVNIYGRDVTRIRKADQKLADAAKFPSENPNPVLRVERNGTVLLANGAARSISGILTPGPPERLQGDLFRLAEDAVRTNENQTYQLESGERVFLFEVGIIENETYLNIYGREITAEREAKTELESANSELEKRVADRTASVRLLQNVLLAANNAESFEAALQAALHEICLFSGWSVGHAYVVEDCGHEKKLTPTGIWHVEKGDGFASLREITESMRFGDPNDLPGWVVARGQARWIEELEKEETFPRLEFTRQAGLKSGMAFPVILHEKVVGVLEFFSLDVADPDLEIIKTLGHVGTQLGSVAERKRSEQALAASQQEAATAHSRLTDALEVISQAIVLFDRDNRIVLFNRKYSEAIVGFTGSPPHVGDSYVKILRGSAAKMHGDKTIEEREAWVQNIIKTRKEQKVRQSVDRNPDGRWMHSEGFETANGGTVSVFTDITETKLHETEMQELLDELGVARDAAVKANATKSQFLANMSHELRTPLNAIIGYSELLIEDLEDDAQETYVPDLVKIQKAGRHLLGLINDILDLAKVEVGKIELFIEEIGVAEMLEDVASTVLPLLTKGGNTLEVDVAEDVGAIRSDLTKLRQNLFNLLSNASKFSKNSEILLRVRLATSDKGKLICFEVVDQGIGMTEEQLAKVFQPFQQADSSTSKEFGGTGLGLTITREFSRKMGGDVAVKSAPGKGSTFTMSVLANAEGQAAPEPDAGTARVREVSADAPLVLIIDDDAGVRDLLCRNLNAAGYRTQDAPDGKTGLKLAEELLPDIITLDVVMPQVDGWSVLSDLKANAKTKHIPIVMVTIVDEKNLGFSLGASEYLSKPIDRGLLAKTIERFTGGAADKTVMIIEDDPETRNVLKRYLTKQGVKVREAENGRIALDQIALARPDLILLDLMMPEMDGFEFIEQYQAHPEWHEIPVVVLTAKTLTDEDRQRLNGWVRNFYDKDENGVESILEEIGGYLTTPV